MIWAVSKEDEQRNTFKLPKIKPRKQQKTLTHAMSDKSFVKEHNLHLGFAINKITNHKTKPTEKHQFL